MGAHESLWSDVDIVTTAAKQNPSALQFAHRDVVLQLLPGDVSMFPHLKEDLRDDIEIAAIAVQKDPEMIAHAGINVKRNATKIKSVLARGWPSAKSRPRPEYD